MTTPDLTPALVVDSREALLMRLALAYYAPLGWSIDDGEEVDPGDLAECLRSMEPVAAEVERIVAERLVTTAEAHRARTTPERQAMWDALGILGFDQDGDPTPGALLAGMGATGFLDMFLRDIREARADHDAAIDEACMEPVAHQAHREQIARVEAAAFHKARDLIIASGLQAHLSGVAFDRSQKILAELADRAALTPEGPADDRLRR